MNEIIPFGKYKGKPIMEVISTEKQYIDWLMLQNWLSEELRNQINVFITHGGKECEETPEHNRLQAMFLDDDFVEKIISISKLIKDFKLEKQYLSFEESTGSGMVDVVITLEGVFVRGDYRGSQKIFIELKTTIGDDYPSILRQCKRTMSRTLKTDCMSLYNIWGNKNSCFLLYEEFNSKHVSEDQFKKMFAMSGIRCIRLDEVTKDERGM